MGSEIFNAEIGSSIYLTDFLDIFIIAILAYTGILFLKQTRSLTAFLGIGILGVIYILARVFHLYVTTFILQSFFSIFIVVLVIVFQDELKKSFEYIITSGTRRVKNKTLVSFSSTIFAVVQATSNLMRKKHGALIILPGKELLERHIRGGNILDGIATASLLESIFDPHSPGHDGAVIIVKDRISKFGVHLPLSQNFKELKNKGTRHSAAIGVSEKVDVLAVVISEERGEVSIAKNGHLKTLKDTRELEKYLLQHYKENFPQKKQGLLKSFFKERGIEKLSALAIAGFAWFFLVFQAEVIQRDFNVPISYINISEETIIESTLPETATITFSARGQAVLNTLTPDSIRVAIPGEKIKSGINEIEIEKNYITHPFNVSLVNISPPIVEVRAQKYKIYEVPVEANISLDSEKIKIKEVSINPSKIKVLVPKKEDRPETLYTEEIKIDSTKETKTFEARVALPETFKLHKDAPRIIYITLITENGKE